MSDEGQEHELDWFGYPVRKDVDMRPVEPVPCPRCGHLFDSGAGLRSHLIAVHGERAARPGRAAFEPGRLRRWVRGLAFLPFWYVVPLNLGISGVLLVAWWGDFELFSAGDQTGVAKAWIFRLSLVPVTCYLAARVATVRRE